MGLLHQVRYLRSVIREGAKALTRSSHWPAVRRDFLESHPACAACGYRKKLQVHHMEPFHLHPELELDEKNLITLCMGPNECHLLIGHGNNFKSYNPNVQVDAAQSLKHPERRQQITESARQNRLKDDEKSDRG